MYNMSNLGIVMSRRRGSKCRTLLFDVHFLQKQTSGTNSYCFSVWRVTIDYLLHGNNDFFHINQIYSRLCKHTSKTVKDFKNGPLALSPYL